MAAIRDESITAHDGRVFDGYCALPDAVDGRAGAPGVVLFQEVFGFDDTMRGTVRDLAGRLADRGYVVLVPDMFWRLRRRFEGGEEPGLAHGMDLAGRLDLGLAVTDMTSVLVRLRAMPECSGGVGGVGFCLGGTLAYLFATSVRVEGRGPDAVVSYYGSGVHDLLDRVGAIECPAMFHYGRADPYLSRDQVAAVEAAVANRPDIAVHHYDTGHAFANAGAPPFHDPEPADIAWGRTLAFLDDVVP